MSNPRLDNPMASPIEAFTQLEFPQIAFDLQYVTDSPPDLLLFVPHPYARTKELDPISKIYQSFMSTKSSPAVGIFYLLGLTSFWNLKNEVTYKIPKDFRAHSPNLWLMILASSGSSKSQQLALLDSIMPKKAEVQPSFSQPASPVSLVEQFRSQGEHLWVEDEAAKYLKRIENPADPLSPIKGHLLKAKGGDRITYHSKKDGEITVENPKLSVVWVNTIAGMLSAISQESMVDGFFSRFGVVMSEKTDHIYKTLNEQHPDRLHDLSEIESSGLREDLERIFSQEIRGNEYTFTGDGVVETFERSSKMLERQFTWMLGDDNQYQPFFDRILMESFKYAIFHHQLRSKPGTEIDTFDMEFGLRVSKFHLCSMTRFHAFKMGLLAYGDKEGRKGFAEKISAHVLSNPSCTLRDLCRITTKPKKDVLEVLERMGLLSQITANGKKRKTV